MKLLLHETYLKVIQNSIGSHLFRNFYIENHGQKKDILEDGKLSCAFFVSSLLKQFNYIPEVHTTVDGLIEDLSSNWKEISVTDARPGDLLLWEKEGEYGHIGFAISPDEAISNSTEKRAPHLHTHDFDGTRPASKAYTYTK